ncbi:hypothetical protein Tco_0602387 [Tanacetum coccineum]
MKEASLLSHRPKKIVNGANVAIPLVVIEEVSTYFANTLYGYFLGKRLAFPIVEDYVKNLLGKDEQCPKKVKVAAPTKVSDGSEEVEIVFVEDKGKPMNDLVDDARKKLEAFPKNSPKRNVVFSPEPKIHYFDRDDMFFYDMGQATEEVEHENAYSTNG